MLEAWKEVCHQFLVTEKRELCEIYKRMYVVYREASLSQNIFTNGLKMGLLQQTCSEKAVHWVETHGLSGI